jgi:hypothetical protein
MYGNITPFTDYSHFVFFHGVSLKIMDLSVCIKNSEEDKMKKGMICFDNSNFDIKLEFKI